MRAVVYQHEEHVGLGLLGPVLQQAGFSVVNRFRATRREDVDAELVVVLGGLMGAYETEVHPFLHEEIALLSERLANDRACLGLCLGAQMLAAAAGSEVFPGKNGFEVGVAPVRWTKDALEDPVIAGGRPRSVAAHWHEDTFKPVSGATLLASNDRYTQQAFRLGKTYAFQFHLELSASELDRWFTLCPEYLGQRGKDVQELRPQLPKLKAAEADNLELLHRLARHFAQAARS